MKQFPLYMFFSYLSVCAELSGEPLSTDEHSRETKEQTISSQFQSCFHQSPPVTKSLHGKQKKFSMSADVWRVVTYYIMCVHIKPAQKTFIFFFLSKMDDSCSLNDL